MWGSNIDYGFHSGQNTIKAYYNTENFIRSLSAMVLLNATVSLCFVGCHSWHRADRSFSFSFGWAYTAKRHEVNNQLHKLKHSHYGPANPQAKCASCKKYINYTLKPLYSSTWIFCRPGFLFILLWQLTIKCRKQSNAVLFSLKGKEKQLMLHLWHFVHRFCSFMINELPRPPCLVSPGQFMN